MKKITQRLSDTVKHSMILALAIAASASVTGQPMISAPDGFATLNGGTTGGGGATPVIVTTAAEFESAIAGDAPAVVVVQGHIKVSDVSIGSNKTVVGMDVNAGLHGGTVRVRGDNVILQNLTLGPSRGDALEISGSRNVFVTKCSFHDSSDELCSIVRGSDLVTVSWCRFYFDETHSHAFGGLIGNRDDRESDRGKLRVTLHHNWYAEGVRGRMPRVRYGQVHIYNNVYSSGRSGYCIGTGFECHIRLESSVFDGTKSPWKEHGALASDGQMGWRDLIFHECAEPGYIPNAFPVFEPLYPFSVDDVESVENTVKHPQYGAGNLLVRSHEQKNSR